MSVCSEWVLVRRQALFTASVLPLNRKITVTLGAHNMTQKESTWQRLEVTEQIVHRNYNSSTSLNDIMLLKVPLPFLPFSTPPSLSLLMPVPFSFAQGPPFHSVITVTLGKNSWPCPREPLPHHPPSMGLAVSSSSFPHSCEGEPR